MPGVAGTAAAAAVAARVNVGDSEGGASGGAPPPTVLVVLPRERTSDMDVDEGTVTSDGARLSRVDWFPPRAAHPRRHCQCSTPSARERAFRRTDPFKAAAAKVEDAALEPKDRDVRVGHAAGMVQHVRLARNLQQARMQVGQERVVALRCENHAMRRKPPDAGP